MTAYFTVNVSLSLVGSTFRRVQNLLISTTPHQATAKAAIFVFLLPGGILRQPPKCVPHIDEIASRVEALW